MLFGFGILSRPYRCPRQVPNLWEVEVKTAEDLRELVARVRSNFAKKNQKAIQDPHAHNVLCLNLVEVPVTGYNEKKSPRQPRVGRLNFIALANATAPLPKKLPSTNSSVHRDIEDSSGVSAWVGREEPHSCVLSPCLIFLSPVIIFAFTLLYLAVLSQLFLPISCEVEYSLFFLFDHPH